MSRAEREKGAEAEREVAAILTAAGFPASRNARNGKSAEDIAHAIPGVYLEVKRRETTKIWEWIAQAREDCHRSGDHMRTGLGLWPRTPLVVFRRNRSEWLACLPLDDLLELLPKGEK